MKNVLLIINALLVLAVAYLLYKQFNGANTTTHYKANIKTDSSAHGMRIAYIEMDSIQNNYEMAKNAQAEINKKQTAMAVEVDKMEKNFKAKLAGYQKQGTAMTPAESEAAKQDLENTQTLIMNKRQAFTQEMNDFIMTKNMSVRKTIEDFLKSYNANKIYTFILANEPGFIYFKDSAYDITNDVLKGLNENYHHPLEK